MTFRSTTCTLGVRLLASAALACTLVLAAPAGAQENCTSEPCVPPPDFTPPTVSISPGSGTYGAGPLTVTIDWSDNNLLDHDSPVITYGGADVTGQFIYTRTNGQGWIAQSTGTLTVEPGIRQLIATVCDASSQCTTATATYTSPTPPVRVSPETTSRWLPGGTASTLRYWVVNMGTSTGHYDVSMNCTGGAWRCSASTSGVKVAAGDSTWVDAYFSAPVSGSGVISVTASGGTVSSTGATTISLGAAPDPGFVGDHLSLERIERGACVTVGLGPDVASECGDLRVVHALPTTTVLNKARTPVLTYNSGHARPHPVVAAQFAGPATVPARIRARLMMGATVVADTVWPGWGANQTRRIALSFDASGLPTGLYPYQLAITAERPDGSQETLGASRSGRMIIVNHSASPFGAGWWLAGVEQLVHLPGDTLKLWVGGDGSARLYRGPGAAGPWLADGFARPDSLYRTPSNMYVRTLPGRSQVWFNAQGQHVRTVNALQQHTEFRWGPLGNGSYLQQIVAPYTTAPHDTTRYVFEYNNNPTATVRNLSRVVAPGIAGARYTQLLADASGRLTRITDPDSSFVQYAYATGQFQDWMGRRTDRRGGIHNFSYLRVRLHTSTRQLNATQNAVTRVQALQTLGMLGSSVRADSVRGGYDGPRTEFCDCSSWGADRWGAPTYVRDAYGQVTTIRRNDIRFPALVTETNAPNGFSTTAAYDERGNLSSSTAWNPYGDGRNATTTYRWHPYWDKPVQVIAPEGEISLAAYDTVTGQRLWEQTGTDAVRRVTYGYYPATRQVQSVTAPGGGTETYTYDARGNLKTVTSPLQVTTEMLRDPLGRVVRTSVPLGTTAPVAYQQDSVVYDVMDQVRETIATGPAMNGVGQQRLHVRNGYDKEGNLFQVERWSEPDEANTDTITTRWEYDLGGRPIVEIAPDSTPGNWADNPRDSTFYDPAGNVVRVRTRRFAESLAAAPSQPDLAYVRMQYDAMNRLTRRIFPAVRYAPRNEGMVRRTSLDMGLNPYPNPDPGEANPYTGLTIPADTAVFVYDLASGLQVHADNAYARVRRQYYRNGQVQYDSSYTRAVDAANFTLHAYGLEYRYDRNGRATELRHPAQLRPATGAAQGILGNRYEYDAATGALAAITDPLGNRFRYTYTVRGEPETLSLPGGITHRYDYNTGGQLERHRISSASTGGSFYPGTWIRDESLQYEARGKLRTAVNQFGLRDNLTVVYSGLGQMVESTHHYRGWYLDTDQDADYSAIERPRHDAMGNMIAIRREGAARVFRRSFLDAAQSRRDTSDAAFGFQPASGRLMERADSLQYEFTHYDAGGNIVFITAAPPPGKAGEWLDRASFYDGGGRLWAVEVRRVQENALVTGQGPRYFTYEEYRLDALGRRVTVRARKFCQQVQMDEQTCSMRSVRRTVWAGDHELYEIQMPESQAENDVADVGGLPLHADGYDPNLFWGRVAYTYGGGIDRPLSIVRMGYVDRKHEGGLHRWGDFAIIPHWDAHGRAQSGTFADGTRRRCRTGYPEWCVQVEWVDGLFPYNPARVPEHWHGTLLTEKRDASGLLYRRNRYYDPATGRFTQEDPIGLAGGVNVYGFAAGDPVTYSDPYGLCPKVARLAPAMAADGPVPAVDAVLAVACVVELGAIGVRWYRTARVAEAVLSQDAARGETEPTLPDREIASEGGVTIEHYYRDGDHGPAHMHVNGGGGSTKIGPNGRPVRGAAELTRAQARVVNAHLSEIRRAGNKIGRWLQYKERTGQ